MNKSETTKTKAKRTTKPRVKTSVGAIKAPRPRASKRPAASPESAAKRVALAIAEAGLDKKAVNVEIIDVLGKVDYADFLVVMSGRSDRQVAALARGIEEDVEAKTKTRCLGVEGLGVGGAGGGRWVLMDFGDVVVHIFHEDVRGYYDLESLWMDAARVPVASAPKA
jgi:ribosome-associated protein